MTSPIGLRLRGHGDNLNPRSFVDAIRLFWGLLQDLDAYVSKDPDGSVEWAIEAIRKDSPAVIEFIGQARLGEDITGIIRREVFHGLTLLRETGERPEAYSDAAMNKIHRLAKMQRKRYRDRLFVQVYANGNGSLADIDEEIDIGPGMLETIESLSGIQYESIGSIVGSLGTITVHRGNEFRVWEEVADAAVRCRFPPQLLDRAKALLGKRVLVYGDVRTNYRGQHTSVEVEGVESYPDDSELPTIEEMSGSIKDFTGGIPLRNFLEEIRNG